jgi:hypothetical protein
MQGKNKKSIPIKEIFHHENISIAVPFILPTKVLEKGYVISDLTFSNIKYDSQWNILNGNIDAMVMKLEDYHEWVKRDITS